MKLVSALALGATLAAAAENIFWIIQLDPLTTTRLDPIISPGKVSAHVHSFVGASGLGPVHDYQRLQESQCTTATVGSDKSNYWVPQLYRKSGNGSLTLMPLSYVNVYYQLRKQPNEPVYEFPAGFRMVAGDPSRSTFDPSDNRQTAINYNCLNFNGGGGPETNGFPDRMCPNDLRAQVRFPSCWDGENAWLPGGAHMAYGAGAHDGNGKCPDSHPYRTMSLFYEFHFKDNIAYEPGARVWATGDTTGYSFHGDFANGWPEGLFTEIFSLGNQCDAFFNPEKCPPLGRTIQKQRSCKYAGVTVDEDIGRGGGLRALPGNNPLYGAGGPQRAGGYTEQARMVDAGGATVAPQDVGNGAIRATVRRRGIVRGDPGTPAVEQISGGGAAVPVSVPVSVPASSAAAAFTASSAVASPNTPAGAPASSAAVTPSPSPSPSPASAGSPAATTSRVATGFGGSNDGAAPVHDDDASAVPVSAPSPSAAAAAPATSSKKAHHGHHGHYKGCRRSRRSYYDDEEEEGDEDEDDY